MTRLGTVKPLLFDQSLIISLDKEWINNFSMIPTFKVTINNKGNLCITSQNTIKRE